MLPVGINEKLENCMVSTSEVVKALGLIGKILIAIYWRMDESDNNLKQMMSAIYTKIGE